MKNGKKLLLLLLLKLLQLKLLQLKLLRLKNQKLNRLNNFTVILIRYRKGCSAKSGLFI